MTKKSSSKVLRRECVAAEKVIIHQGAEGSTAYLIQSGKAEVFVTNPDNSETSISELGPGDIFGEMALLGNGRRVCSVRTLEACVLIIIAAHELDAAINFSKDLYKTLAKIMAGRLKSNHDRHMKDELADLGFTKETAETLLAKLKVTFDKNKKHK